jgi:hypothetical protein
VGATESSPLVHDLSCAAPQRRHRIECLEHLATCELLTIVSLGSSVYDKTQARHGEVAPAGEWLGPDTSS